METILAFWVCLCHPSQSKNIRKLSCKYSFIAFICIAIPLDLYCLRTYTELKTKLCPGCILNLSVFLVTKSDCTMNGGGNVNNSIFVDQVRSSESWSRLDIFVVPTVNVAGEGAPTARVLRFLCNDIINDRYLKDSISSMNNWTLSWKYFYEKKQVFNDDGYSFINCCLLSKDNFQSWGPHASHIWLATFTIRTTTISNRLRSSEMCAWSTKVAFADTPFVTRWSQNLHTFAVRQSSRWLYAVQMKSVVHYARL